MPPQNDLRGYYDRLRCIQRPWLEETKRYSMLSTETSFASIEGDPYREPEHIDWYLGLDPTDFSTMDPNPVDHRALQETTEQKLIRLTSLPNRKTLSVDSPSFTPGTLGAPKSSSITSQAANAAPFTPRGLSGGKSHRSFYRPSI